ncbi:hypothetical protein ES703_122651 [subsurface metagenome]
MGAGIAQKIPRGAHKGVHSIRLPLSRGGTPRTGSIDELLTVLQGGFTGRSELGILR